MQLNIRKYHLFLLSLLSGLLLAASWPANGIAIISFIALVPLFLVDYYVSMNKNLFSRGSMVLFSFITFLTFNLLTTWWVINSTLIGAVLAFMLNSFFMALVYGVFHLVKNKAFSIKTGFLAFLFFWISYEYLHMHWSLTWSWLVLGNVFASTPKLVQWYEFTGVFGGSAWVIIVNSLFMMALIDWINNRKVNKGVFTNVMGAMLLIILPISYSISTYLSYQEKGELAEVVILQPNIDPYNEQYEIPQNEIISRFLDMARKNSSTENQLIVGPESALARGIWESRLNVMPVIDSLKTYISKHPNTSILLGASTSRYAPPGEPLEVGARKYLDEENAHYYSYNTALMLNSTRDIQKYHKSILVPGVEQMPFPKLMKPLEKFAIDLGGTTGTLGISKTQHTLNNHDGTIQAAPIICYESIYGEYVGKFVNNGANLIAIITNDGWWGNTPGHRQHFEYARLRAIEYRRDIVRSANTGISSFIDQKGADFQKTEYWTKAILKRDVHLNQTKTYYAQHGDFIAKLCIFISSLLILLYISVSLRGRKNTN